ncbi:MAG: GTP cyclohydrolase II [Pseudomonadota bacterium]
MHTYIDPTVRSRLIADGKLRRIDMAGQPMDPNAPVDPDNLGVNLLGPIPLPVRFGDWQHTFQWFAAVRNAELGKVEALAEALRNEGGQHLFSEMASSMAVNSVLVLGDPTTAEMPLVRVHSSCLTGDVFGSLRCECGPQLEKAMREIAANPGGGVLVYMAGHEGRGIGLWAKAATYLLQDAGEDTYQANRSLGLPDDSRNFSVAAAILLSFIGNRPFRLMTNNPKKIADLNAAGLTEFNAVKHVAGVSDWNRRYLASKQQKGHQFSDDDLD